MPRIVETETRYASEPDCRTAAEMTEICCETAGKLPCCEEVDREWGGFSEEEVLAKLGIKLDDQGRDEEGRYVEIRFEPRDRPCGEMVTKYDLNKGNCCNKVPPLQWDDVNTPDILPHGKWIWVYVTGGQAPYEFSVTSNALWFEGGWRNIITSVPHARLFAGETFCGGAAVRVEDGCSIVVGTVRSDLGHWELLGQFSRTTDWGQPPDGGITEWGAHSLLAGASGGSHTFAAGEFAGDAEATADISRGMYRQAEAIKGYYALNREGCYADDECARMIGDATPWNEYFCLSWDISWDPACGKYGKRYLQGECTTPSGVRTGHRYSLYQMVSIYKSAYRWVC